MCVNSSIKGTIFSIRQETVNIREGKYNMYAYFQINKNFKLILKFNQYIDTKTSKKAQLLKILLLVIITIHNYF